LHAGLTADTALVVEVDNAVVSAKKRYGGTYFNTRSVIAMVATEHREVSSRIRVAALFNILHPCAIYAHRDVVLFFAGNRAVMTTDATVLIDYKSVSHFIPFESEYSISTRKFFTLIAEKNEKGQLILQYAEKHSTKGRLCHHPERM
jgi:hypothetical protein